MLGYYQVASQLVASRVVLSSIELVGWFGWLVGWLVAWLIWFGLVWFGLVG
jgi:hypothetical protein